MPSGISQSREAKLTEASWAYVAFWPIASRASVRSSATSCRSTKTGRAISTSRERTDRSSAPRERPHPHLVLGLPGRNPAGGGRRPDHGHRPRNPLDGALFVNCLARRPLGGHCPARGRRTRDQSWRTAHAPHLPRRQNHRPALKPRQGVRDFAHPTTRREIAAARDSTFARNCIISAALKFALWRNCLAPLTAFTARARSSAGRARDF